MKGPLRVGTRPATSVKLAKRSRSTVSTIIHEGLAVYRFGVGHPVLFMGYPHGLVVAGDATSTAIVEGLRGIGCEVLTFDPPGAGRSARPIRLTMDEMIGCADETLAVCGVTGPVTVFGHSQGGTAALAFALKRPQRVSTLVLACTASGPPAYFGAPGAIWNRSHPDHMRTMVRAALYWLTRRRAAETLMLNTIFRASWVDRSHFQPRPIHVGDWLRSARPRTWWNQAARPLDYSDRLREVEAPALVLAGRHDPQMPPSCAEELAASLRDSRLVVFEESGHYPFVEEPEEFWAAVRSFLMPVVAGAGVAQPLDREGIMRMRTMTGHSDRREGSKQHPEQSILGMRVRRDGLAIMLFGVSALGVVLNSVVFPRLLRIGGILQQVSTGILFGRVIVFTASGIPQRQRLLPRSLTVVELVVDGVATIAGLWMWFVQPFLSHRVELPRRAAPWLRTSHTIRQDTARDVTVSRVAAVAAFVLHTLRLAIYLSPSRGLRESSVSEALLPQRSRRKGTAIHSSLEESE